LKFREVIHEGIESAPGSIEKLYSGGNDGKLVIRL
jgi:NADPH-dependent curcumin reductase CurA